MRVSQKKNGNVRVVELSGSLTVGSSRELKRTISENLRKGNMLELVLGHVTDVDISFIQILVAAVKAAEKGDRGFSVRTPVPETFLKSVELAGLLNHSRCSLENCVWCSLAGQNRGV